MLQLKLFLFITYYSLRKLYLVNPLVVLAQFWHETAGFKSDIFLENNNVCGMKTSTRNYDIGENRGHAVFSNVYDSIRDYFDRMIQFKIKPNFNSTTYISNMQSKGQWNFAEDPNYTQKVVNVYKAKFRKKPLLIISIFPLLAIIVYFFIKFKTK